MRVVFSEASRHDLRAIIGFIAADSPARARSFLAELEQACVSLADKPLRFPLVPAYEARAYRRRPYGNYSIIMDLHAALGD